MSQVRDLLGEENLFASDFKGHQDLLNAEDDGNWEISKEWENDDSHVLLVKFLHNGEIVHQEYLFY